MTELETRLYDALKETRAALLVCADQIDQMRGLFDDEDGTIQAACDDAGAADTVASAAMVAYAAKHDIDAGV